MTALLARASLVFFFVVLAMSLLGCGSSEQVRREGNESHEAETTKAVRQGHEAADSLGNNQPDEIVTGSTQTHSEKVRKFVEQLQAEKCVLWEQSDFNESGISLVLNGKDKVVRPDRDYQILWEVPDDSTKPIWLTIQNHSDVFETAMLEKAMQEWNRLDGNLHCGDITHQLNGLVKKFVEERFSPQGRRELEQECELIGYRAIICVFDENELGEDGKWARIQIELRTGQASDH